MKRTALALLFLALAAGRAKADEHHPIMGDCSAEINSGQVGINANSTGFANPDTFVINARTSATSVDLGCAEASYVKIAGFYDSVSFTPTFGGPNITSSGWDCNHTTVNYSVYNADSNGNYYLAGQGNLYGQLINGVCTHDAANSPSSGTNSFTVSNYARSPIIAVYSWTHNDTALAHPGDLCNGLQCYWPTWLTVQASGRALTSAWDPNLCIDIPDFGRSQQNNDYVQVYGCHGGSDQRFNRQSDGTIRTDAGMCLDVPALGRPPANGDKLQIYQCHGGVNQQFDVLWDGSIQSRTAGGLCLDIPYYGRAPQNGDRLQLFGCQSSANQKFYMTR